jgi:hypothetical protein
LPFPHFARAFPGFASSRPHTVQEQAAKRAARAAKYGEQIDDHILDKTKQAQQPEIVQFQADLAKAKDRREKYVDMWTEGDMDCTDGGLKEAKRDFGADTMRRTDTLHVYGTDVLSTEDIIRYFLDYSPQWVEWINDSSCNVKFPEEFSSQRALWACRYVSPVQPHYISPV